jgi:hypothetical protein
MPSLDEVWSLLWTIRTVSFTSHSEAGTGWDGTGDGVVELRSPAPDVLIFDESGRWQSHHHGRSTRFANVFRWTRLPSSLSLEHLRFGADRPVFLFDLAPGEDGLWRDVTPHLCGEDCYSGTLKADGKELIVEWSIRGPRKRESIRYVYQ